jgi:hypothetical protein
MNARPVFPELITGRDDGLVDGPWTIDVGWALRGHASCDFVQRRLEVPLGITPIDRLIRAHELVHVRVSPHDVHPMALHPEIHQRALECAEEYRVNLILDRLGFDVSSLRDGSEVNSAQRLAANGAWDEVVYFFVATMGTGAERDFLKGLRRSAPQWIKPLQVMRRRIVSMYASWSVADIAATSRGDELQLPQGFELFSLPLAQLMMSVAGASTPSGPDELRQFRRSLEPGGRRAPSGHFAELVLDESIEYHSVQRRCNARRDRPDVTGTALRYPNRLLSDPQQRAFARSRRSPGGVVVVDQSGSMDLSSEQVDELLAATPGAFVVGYSHRPGDRGALPNAWVIAQRAQRSRSLPNGNVGNGVDGPVLRFATSQRHRGDQLIWVTDGQITDSNDHPCAALSMECAELVRRHRIVLVRTVAEAVGVLRKGRRQASEPAQSFGRVGAALLRMTM